jgi:imidazolonepropionase-like amidohydrolase
VCRIFYGVGRSISVKGGHASDRGAFLPQAPEDVPGIIAEQKAAGADAIKLIYDDLVHVGLALPAMRPEVMAAIIRESHNAGLKAYVHAPQLQYAKRVLRAGADGLVHAIVDAPVDDEFIALMKKNRALYVTTHSVRRAFVDLPQWTSSLERLDIYHRIPEAVYNNLKRRKIAVATSQMQYEYLKSNLRRVYDAGILVVAGTDTAVPGVLLGISSQMELVVLVEDGLTPHEALRTATVNAAQMLGREADLGSVKVGKIADLLILDKDPIKDISNIRFIQFVLRGGQVYEAAALRNADKWGL